MVYCELQSRLNRINIYTLGNGIFSGWVTEPSNPKVTELLEVLKVLAYWRYSGLLDKDREKIGVCLFLRISPLSPEAGLAKA